MSDERYTAYYSAYLPLQATPACAGEIRAWAGALEVKTSEVLREIVAAGLEALRPEFERRAGGKLDPDYLREMVEQAPRRDKWSRMRRGENS